MEEKPYEESTPNHLFRGCIMGFGAGMTCPHCDCRALQRRTRAITPLTREKTYRCNNDECGHIFVSIEEIQRTVVQPRVHREGINLQMSRLTKA